VRANNTVGYFLPAMGGLYGQLMWAPEDGALPGQNYIGGRIGYAAGPINVAAAYGETKEALGSENLEAYNVGGSWNFGFMTLMGQYHNYSVGARETENFLIGGTLPLGSGLFKASYNFTSVDAGIAALPGAPPTGGDSQMIAVGYVYDLSKRTALYGHYAIIDNDPGVRFVVPGGKDRTANNATGFGSQGFEFGVRHSF
jgi:predicted porin